MGRRVQRYSPTENMPTVVLLAHTGTAGTTQEYNLIDGSIKYYERTLKNSFDFTMIDNIGAGQIRVTYNRPAIDITDYTDGAKTLRSGDSLYLEDSVWNIKIYFIQDSTVELILKSDKDVWFFILKIYT